MNRGFVYLRPTHLVFIRRTGDYATSAAAAWSDLLAWMDKHRVPREGVTFFGLARDNPLNVAPTKCRFDACLEVPSMLEGSAALEAVQRQRLPGGSYTRHPYKGHYGHALRTRVLSLATEWTPSQGLRLADERPSVLILRGNPLLPRDQEAKADICIPVSTTAQKGTAAA